MAVGFCLYLPDLDVSTKHALVEFKNIENERESRLQMEILMRFLFADALLGYTRKKRVMLVYQNANNEKTHKQLTANRRL